MSGRERVEEALMLQRLATDDESARITQICCQDHTGQVDPHVHLQIHFSNDERSTWFILNDVTVADLEAVMAAQPGRRPRLHMHGPRATTPAAPRVVSSLPRKTLTAAEAAALCMDPCPVCLAEYEAGDEVTCMPCDGLHKCHRACIEPWLREGNTCPTCRFELGAERDDEAFNARLQRAKAELASLKSRPPADAIGCRLSEVEPATEIAPTRQGSSSRGGGAAAAAAAEEEVVVPGARRSWGPAWFRRETRSSRKVARGGREGSSPGARGSGA